MNFLRIISIFCFATCFAHAETIVRVVGLEKRSDFEVLELIGDRLEHVRSSPASAPLADDAAFLLTQVLRKDGYADVSVDWKIVSRNEIQLSVNEGMRLTLGKVTVIGVSKDDTKRLEKIYAKPAEKGRSLGLASAPYREGDADVGLAFIRQDLNAHGYWQAEVEQTAKSTDPKTGAVQVTIQVRQGPLFTIGQPKVFSANPLVAQRAVSVFSPFIGKDAKTSTLNSIRQTVEEQTASAGFPNAKIRMAQSLEGDRFVPVFTIDLGSRVKLRQIHLDGLKKTNPNRIMKRLRNMEGDWYDEPTMQKRLREFLATGAFSSANLETTEVGEQGVDATLHFEEGKAREIGFAAGVGTFEGVITQMTYRDHNLYGQLLDFSAGLEFSSRGLLGEVRLTEPWLWNTDISTTARLFALIYTWEGYSTLEAGVDDRFTWKYGDHYKLELYAGYSVVNTSTDGLPLSELGETVYTNPKIRVTQALDFRDSPVLPKNGWHLECPLEFGSALGNTEISYMKTGLSGGWYHVFNPRYEIGFGGEFSAVIPSSDVSELPINLRVFNGGARTVRSFPEREMGPQVKGYATGGEAAWSTNLEVSRTIAGSFKATAFFDAGSISRNFEDIGSSEIELAPGLGIRFDLPIGPVRFEYGYNLTRDTGEPPGAFHFAIGCAY
ncbi:MAG: BamA/TamA family outer membrane protein [Gloeobacteraceae cyanobacterium ES-bin-144]|nr:BamA/TamA family outer membrane protein [Verrucomicrobiales bacterium]